MTTISSIALAAITGGNAAGNGQTGDRYRTDPNDNGSGQRGGVLGGGWSGQTAGGGVGTVGGAGGSWGGVLGGGGGGTGWSKLGR